MKDVCLKFNDAAEMKVALLLLGFLENEDEPRDLYHNEMLLDIIGPIYHPQNNDSENIEYIFTPGYHVNLRVINDELDLSVLNNFIVTPETPVRVWA